MSIKLSRARRLAQTGRYPATYDALFSHLSTKFVRSATAAQIADAVDSLAACACESKAIALRDAISEGCIWDNNVQQLLELNCGGHIGHE